MIVLLWVATVAALGEGTVLNYSGRISVDGKPFTGAGYFAFSIQQTNGAVFWTSGDFPIEGKTNVPQRTVSLSVKDGLYNIRLGDPTLGMEPLDSEVLRRATSPVLRIWFSDGRHGWHRAGVDVPLGQSLQAAASAPISVAQAETILRELREVRSLIERPRPAPQVISATAPAPAPAPQMMTVSIRGAPSLGRPDAPLVLVEFTDFECPYCKDVHDQALAQLTKKYVETGKLRLISRNLPLPFHPNAATAAVAALCAHDQQQFWPMREKLFATSKSLNRTNYLRAAEELKLDANSFRECLDKKSYAERVQKELHDALSAGINSTPSFVLGKLSGEEVTGELLIGARTLAAFEQDIEKRLSAP